MGWSGFPVKLALSLVGIVVVACAHVQPSPSKSSYQVLQKAFRQSSSRLGNSPIGPVAFTKRINYSVALGPEETVLTDLFTTNAGTKSPLVIIAHGNHSRKEAHRYQAMSLASWGINALVVQLVNHSEWLNNAKLIEKLAKLVHNWPAILGNQVDPNKIILMGHSFGGSAVTLAAANKAPVQGLILLDPAVVHDAVLEALPKVQVPIALLGADPKVFRSRKRAAFYNKSASEKLRLSIVGATHDDLQHPSMFSIYAYNNDPFTSRQHQTYAQSLIVLSAYSLAAGGDLNYAYLHLRRDLEEGKIKHLSHQPAPISHFAH